MINGGQILFRLPEVAMAMELLKHAHDLLQGKEKGEGKGYIA